MDRLLTTTVFNNEFSLTVLDTTDLVNEAIKLHGLSPLAAAALGRTLTAAAFMCSTFKDEKAKLSITIDGNGDSGRIVVCGNGKLEMRGSIDNTKAEMPLKANGKLDVGGFVGTNGKVSVIKDLGLKEPYSGSTRLISGEIAEDFAAYFAYSEQIPTAIALGVKIGTDCTCVGAGGVILQAMPNASDESIAKAEAVMQKFANISSMVKQGPLEDLIIDNFDCESLFYKEAHPVYKCLCSREYIESVLISIGFKDLYDIIDKDGKIEINCQFCGKNYVFYKSDIDKLKEENEKKRTPQT